jgi:hypothetical protein
MYIDENKHDSLPVKILIVLNFPFSEGTPLKFRRESVRRFQQRDNLSLRDRLIDHRPFLNLV